MAVIAMVLSLYVISTPRLAAQELFWIQVEANSTLAQSQERALLYSELFDDLAGFQLTTGWYALVIGPYADEEQALADRRSLLSRGALPRDAYVTQGPEFRQQVWPVGAATNGSGEETDDVVTAEIIVDLPEIELEPQETLADARRAEAQLSRDERAALQVALQWKGFYSLAIDASFGPGTRRAMAAYQESRGFEPTGVLTTAQRSQLLDEYAAELAILGMGSVRDETAGIEIDLPLSMVRFDRYDPPFAHYGPVNDSGVQVLLISQTGTQATLFGLYEIMQTLEIVPLEGDRSRGSNSFTLTGQNDTLRSHSYAEFRNGHVKGYVLVWPPEQDGRMEQALAAMQSSFSTFGGALPDTAGQPSAIQRSDLISGLEVRRPVQARSGFYIDGRGNVLTTAEAVAGCERITIDETYDATVQLLDEALGIALLAPVEPLAPLDFARFLSAQPRQMSEVSVAGFSFEDLLTRPVMTFGTLTGLTGLSGETGLNRLTIEVMPGDVGGPVFDGSGSVLGMLLPRFEEGGRLLPGDVNFIASAEAINTRLSQAGVQAELSNGEGFMTPEALTRRAADMTVLVSCWN